jgi:hypothetical protein
VEVHNTNCILIQLSVDRSYIEVELVNIREYHRLLGPRPRTVSCCVCWLALYPIYRSDPNRPYKVVRVNQTEGASLSILALLSSILSTLEVPLSTRAAIGMAFLTIVPAFVFAGIVMYGYMGHIERIVGYVKQKTQRSLSPPVSPAITPLTGVVSSSLSLTSSPAAPAGGGEGRGNELKINSNDHNITSDDVELASPSSNTSTSSSVPLAPMSPLSS